MDEWDLQAVVRGCNYNNNEVHNSSQACFDPLSCFQENNDNDPFQDLNCFLESTRVNLTELEQQTNRPLSPTIDYSLFSSPTMLITSSMSAPKDQVEEENNIAKSSSLAKSCKKRRKKEQKREVKHVTEEGLSSDKWAWRKYGQKPIKGSPYPRSYYRCSSSKGCSARKQVERSHLNPEIFIVTYTAAQHTHAYPTRRSSLAGTTRSKFLADHSKTNKHSNFDSNLDQVQTTSITKMEEVENEMGSSETDLLPDHKMLLLSSLYDHQEIVIDKQTSELLDLQNDGFMDHFSDDFLSSWFSMGQFVCPEQ